MQYRKIFKKEENSLRINLNEKKYNLPSQPPINTRVPNKPAVPQTIPAIGFRGFNPKADIYNTWAIANDSIPQMKQQGQMSMISPMHEKKSPKRILRAYVCFSSRLIPWYITNPHKHKTGSDLMRQANQHGKGVAKTKYMATVLKKGTSLGPTHFS